MCGRFVSPDDAAIERAWHVGRGNNNPFPAHYNVAPTSQVPILRRARDSADVELAIARWGLIPHFWTKPKPPNFTFNARLEEAHDAPMWRDPFRRSRCLVPALGWYEWRRFERTDPETGEIEQAKEPHFIRRLNFAPVCFAGLMSWWRPGEGVEGQLTCTIITMASVGPVGRIHDRMPVALSDDAHAAWLDRALVDAEEVEAIIRTHALTEELAHYPVSTRVNNSKNEGVELIEAADPLCVRRK